MQVWRFRSKQQSTNPAYALRKLDRNQQFAYEQADSLVRIINESMVLAATAKDRAVRISRLNLATDKLRDLKVLVEPHPFIKLTRVADFERSLAAVDRELFPGKDVGRSQRGDFPNSDIVEGFRFSATMQMRIPLRVLARHGEMHRGPPEHLPAIAKGMWEGVWMPKLRTFRESGVPLDELPEAAMASDIGPIPVDGWDFLPFLLAVRQAVECVNPIGYRIEQLGEVLADRRWQHIVSIYPLSADEIIDRFFPPFLNTVPRLPPRVADQLRSLMLCTPAAISAAPDALLLQIKGMGPQLLEALRMRCREIEIDREQDRLDAVER
jgi:hypothetical protein